MDYIRGSDRRQAQIIPVYMEDYIRKENPVRVIDAFVDALDLVELEFKKAQLSKNGRPPYAPADLLKLYIYGYFNRIRSSRMLARECKRNVEIFYLINHITPDFRTISDFRKDNRNAISKVFREFGKLCLKLGLYKKELLSVDGTKFRAANSKDNCFNEAALDRKLDHIEEKMNDYMQQMEEFDQEEKDTSEPKKEEIQKQIEDLKERKEKYKGYKKQLKESGDTQLLLTDPQARRMHSKDGFHCCYNVQTAVDTKSHLIAEYEVTNHNTDQGLLTQIAEKTKKQLEVEVLEVVADKGYESRKDILNCVYNGTVPNVIFKYDKEERLYVLPYEEAEISAEELASTQPEMIKKCLHAGYLPDCYQNTAISLQVQETTEKEISCFLKEDDQTVVCPMGKQLTAVKKRGANTIYKNKDACRQCPNRCTSSKNAKEVSFGPNTEMVTVRMNRQENVQTQKIPMDKEISVNNHTLDRKDYRKEKMISLRIRPDPEKYKERKCTSEHPFGTVKWYHGAHYLLCKGIEKTSAEIGLSFRILCITDGKQGCINNTKDLRIISKEQLIYVEHKH